MKNFVMLLFAAHLACLTFTQISVAQQNQSAAQSEFQAVSSPEPSVTGLSDEAGEGEQINSTLQLSDELGAAEVGNDEADPTDPSSEDPTSETQDLSGTSTSGDVEEEPDQQGSAQSVLNYAGSSGEMSYSVDFEVPEMRGLEPKLGLVYNSQISGRAGADANVGVGWKLKGLSSIRRMNRWRGVPSYDTEQDIFMLDGIEMLKCNNNPILVTGVDSQSWKYAETFVKDQSSPSCSSGGNFTTLQETYFKIFFNQTQNTFTVTQKDGTQFIYESIGDLVGSVGSIPPDAQEDANNLRFRREWLLTEIKDVQVNPNKVTFTYEFASTTGSGLDSGFPFRVTKIAYAGYDIDFHYSVTGSRPISTFATGTRYNGEQFHRLEAVTMASGSSKIRAYDLTFDVTSLTRAHRLKEVTQYGQNYVVQSDKSVSGTSLPSYQFSYTEDSYSTETRYYDGLGSIVTPANSHDPLPPPDSAIVATTQHYQNLINGAFVNGDETFHPNMRVVDTDGDGRDELLALGQTFYSAFGFNQDPNGVGDGWRDRPAHFKFDENGDISRDTSTFGLNFFSSHPEDASNTFLALSRWLPSAQQVLAIGAWYHPGNAEQSIRTFDIKSNDEDLTSIHTTANGLYVKRLVGNFDRDPQIEVMVGQDIYDIRTSGVAQAIVKKNITIQSDPTCTGPAMGNARVVDVNADGLDDVLFFTYWGYTCLRLSLPDGFEDRLLGAGYPENYLSANRYEEVEKQAFAFGDFNGDGVPDSARYGTDYFPLIGSEKKLSVAIGYGDGRFGSYQEWNDTEFLPGSDLWSTLNTGNDYFATFNYSVSVGNSIIPTDLNGDGLDDIISFGGYTPSTNFHWARKKLGTIRFFLSTGSDFEEVAVTDGASPFGFAGVGDFNGDGRKDIALTDGPRPLSDWLAWATRNVVPPGAKPGVLFGTGMQGPKLKEVTTSMGEVITVTYEPSTSFSDDQIPGVRMLVSELTSDPGHGLTSTYTFNYSGGRFDYVNRKSLGFQEIRVTMPTVSGETEDLVQITNYLTANIASAGLISRQRLQFGGTLYQDTKNTWNVDFVGNGPYRSRKVKEETGVRHSTGVIYSTREFSYNEYNELRWIKNLGFDGSQDNTTTVFEYYPNTTKYIVNKVASKVRNKAQTTTAQPHANRLFAEFFHYDGNTGTAQSPSRGNLTRHFVWSGDVSNDNARRIFTRTHDNYGNVLTEANTQNHTTTNTYVGPRKLFLQTQSNALNQTTTTNWTSICQAPTLVTDPNGLETNYTYDTFCRETLERVSWGTGASNRFDTATSYLNFGDPVNQRIRHTVTSSNPRSGNVNAITYQYFDGAGRVYKESRPGSTSDVLSTSAIVRKFDARGRTLWESNPLLWADATDNDATSGERTTTTYDPIGRPEEMRYADGAKTEIVYRDSEFTVQGQTTRFPEIETLGPSCHDNDSTTICEHSREVLDSRQNKVKDRRKDYLQTDTDGASSVWRTTNYEYDLLDRLVYVQDPGSLKWRFTYDVYGNLIEQEDPGLGRWTMEYNIDNTLSRQIDARGQEMKFWYDALDRETRKRVQKKNDAGSHQYYVNTYSEYDTAASGYFNTGRLTRQYTTGPGAHGIDFYYDKRGNLTQRVTEVDGKYYHWYAEYRRAGHLKRQTYHDTPGQTGTKWTPIIIHDTANRVETFGNYITGTTYDHWDRLLVRTYGNGSSTTIKYNNKRGWVTDIIHKGASGGNIARHIYTKSKAGRVLRTNSRTKHGRLDFTYDYLGRLLTATHFENDPNTSNLINRSFTYDRAGRMQSKSDVGIYNYSNAKQVGANGHSIHGHAPQSITDPVTLQTTVLEYDENGNMTKREGPMNGPGDDKVMTYDGENRPLSVTYNGNTTEYVYAADGSRLKRIEKAGSASETVTLYLNGVEIRIAAGGDEEILAHLTDEVRLTMTLSSAPGATPETREDYLHHDQLGSVIGITNKDGASAQVRDYHPFGEIAKETTSDPTLTDEDKGFIGERYDADAGLQFLNNRYYDPELALFIQPDWLPITEVGVGTNRYAYANNDPINKFDPQGNSWFSTILGIALSFVPGLQPVGAAAISAGIAGAETLAAGGSFGDALKSGVLTFATQLAFQRVQQGIFSNAQGSTTSNPYLSTQDGGGIAFGQKVVPVDQLKSDLQLSQGSAYMTRSGARVDAEFTFINRSPYAGPKVTAIEHLKGYQTAKQNITKIANLKELAQFGAYTPTGHPVPLPELEGVGILITPDAAGTIGFSKGFHQAAKAAGVSYATVPSMTSGIGFYGNYWQQLPYMRSTADWIGRGGSSP